MNRRTHSVPASFTTACLLRRLDGVACVVAGSAGRACGFHDDVSVARGALNWTYPDALHVIGAISSAVVEKRLTWHDNTAPDLFGSQYHATAKALERFAELLGAGPDEAPPLSFSIVLVEPMLWTRFEARSGRIAHADTCPGPQPDRYWFCVTGQSVIHAIANEELGIAEANRLGLIRLYGSEQQIAAFLGVLRRRRTRAARRNQDQTRRASDTGSRSAAMQ